MAWPRCVSAVVAAALLGAASCHSWDNGEQFVHNEAKEHAADLEDWDIASEADELGKQEVVRLLMATPASDGCTGIYSTFQTGAACERSALIHRKHGGSPTGVLASQAACEASCTDDPSCEYYLYKDHAGATTRYDCATYKACSASTAYGDGVPLICQKAATSTPAPAADGCTGIYSTFRTGAACERSAWIHRKNGGSPTGVLASQAACEASCTDDPSCEYYLYKDHAGAVTRYDCTTYKACSAPTAYGDGVPLICQKAANSQPTPATTSTPQPTPAPTTTPQPTPKPTSPSDACVNIAGDYMTRDGKRISLSQTGCSGTSDAGWSYTVKGSTATIGNGIQGTVVGSPDSYSVYWFIQGKWVTYTRAPAKDRPRLGQYVTVPDGRRGKITTDDGSGRPFYVQFDNGDRGTWFRMTEVELDAFQGAARKSTPAPTLRPTPRPTPPPPTVQRCGGSYSTFKSGEDCEKSALIQQTSSNYATGVLRSEGTCAASCTSDPSCAYYLWKNHYGAQKRYECATYKRCSFSTPYSDGVSTVCRKAGSQTFRWKDLGAGCCADRAANALWRANRDDLDACKEKCLTYDDCKFIEYGWTSAYRTFCVVLSDDATCPSLMKGPGQCGRAGHQGVHTYKVDRLGKANKFSVGFQIPSIGSGGAGPFLVGLPLMAALGSLVARRRAMSPANGEHQLLPASTSPESEVA